MALQTSSDNRQSISLAAVGQDVARRVAAAGYPEMPRNAGNRRTKSKRAMLAALEEIGASW